MCVVLEVEAGDELDGPIAGERTEEEAGAEVVGFRFLGVLIVRFVGGSPTKFSQRAGHFRNVISNSFASLSRSVRMLFAAMPGTSSQNPLSILVTSSHILAT